MWIGSSIFFNWLDSAFKKNPEEKEDEVVGEVWMVHGGGFYHVKKKYLKPSQIPEELYWFKWEAGFTWITGFLLFIIVYYLNANIILIDKDVASITPITSVIISLSIITICWFVYDNLWLSPISEKPIIASVLSYLILFFVIYFLTNIYSSRGAYMHVGVIMGTLMAANVWLRILPAQAQMLDAVKKGQKPDLTKGLRAKMRSKHNNYMTYPVIFIMISNHFPHTYGDKLNWLILILLIISSTIIKHIMNLNENFSFWGVPSIIITIITVTILYFIPSLTYKEENNIKEEKVSFFQVKQIINNRCVSCHSLRPTDDVYKSPPLGLMLDKDENILSSIAKIKIRAVDSKTMPLANKTNMTDEERRILGLWIKQGAIIDK
jgi:uncharacterized membrane protein